jgi:hypothetical protein
MNLQNVLDEEGRCSLCCSPVGVVVGVGSFLGGEFIVVSGGLY